MHRDECKKTVDTIFSDSVNGSVRQSRISTGAIRILTTGALTGEQYVSELLQNADDCGHICPEKQDIQFILTDNYLIFRHIGKHFDQKDVEGICGIADPDREKVDLLDQIGNKGIGFKAIFNIADYVLILSQNYSFRFDEKYERWKDNKVFPWQITPIWTEENEIPSEIKDYVDSQSVNFVFKIRKPEIRREISDTLKKLLNNPRAILFLRNVKSISFVDRSRTEFKSQQSRERVKVDEKENKNIIHYKIKRDDQEIANWVIFSKDIEIPQTMKKELNASELVSRKYKEATKVKLSLAIQHDMKKCDIVRSGSIFCYLPTAATLNFPFLVNSDFFLNASRSHFGNDTIEKKWNVFLLKKVFVMQFGLLQYLGERDDLWRYVPKLIANPKDVLNDQLGEYKQEFETEFNLGLERISIVKNRQKSKLMKVKEGCLDLHKFLEHFGTDIEKENCIHPEIEGIDVLLYHGAKSFRVDQIIAYIKEPSFIEQIQEPKKNIKLLNYLFFLYKKVVDSKASNAQESLAKINTLMQSENLFLSKNNILTKSGEIFFPREELNYLFNKFEFITLIHPDISKFCQENKEFHAWLKERGVRDINLRHLVSAVNQHEDRIIEFTQLVYDKKFDETEQKCLKDLKVKTQSNKYVKVDESYLPGVLEPRLNLDVYLQNSNLLLSLEYIESKHEKTDELIKKWKEFFIDLGVEERLNESNLPKIITYLNKQKTNLILFTQFIFQKYYLTAQNKDHFRRVINPHLKKLKFLAKDKKYYDYDDLYLANAYQPELKLEQLINTFHFLAEDYLGDSTGSLAVAAAWGEFFKEIGLQSKIRFSVLSEKSRDSVYGDGGVNKEYIEYLEGCAYPKTSDGDEKLYPIETKGYMYQHKILPFFDIENINDIIHTRLFWEILHTNFDEFSTLSTFRYTTQRSSRDIITNIKYYVGKAVNHTYQRSPQQLYSPKIRLLLGDITADLPVAMIAERLDESQLQYFGFKTVLSVEDCLLLLKKIALSEINKTTLSRLTVIYQHLLKSLENKPIDEHKLEGLRLLTDSDKFVPVNILYGLISKNIRPKELADRFVRKPENIPLDQFEKLCELLHISVICDAGLDVTVINQQIASNLITDVKKKINYLALIESSYHDLTAADLINFLNKFLVKTTLIIDKIKCYLVDKIIVKKDDLFSQEVSSWHQQDQFIIYHQALSDPIVFRNVCSYLCSQLKLKMNVDDVWFILLSAGEDIKNKYQQRRINNENLEIVNNLIKNPQPMDVEEKIAATIQAPVVMARSPRLVIDDDGDHEMSPADESKKSIGERKQDNSEKNAKSEKAVYKSIEYKPVLETKESDKDQQMVIIKKEDIAIAAIDKTAESLNISTNTFSSKKRPRDESKTESFKLQESDGSPSKRRKLDEKGTFSSPQSSESAASSSGSASSQFSTAMLSEPASLARVRGLFSASLSQEQKTAIGRVGEEHIYNFLKDKYKKQHGDNFEEKEDCLLIKTKDYKKEVVWCNKNKESGQHYDFIVKKTTHDGRLLKRRFIEVKTSRQPKEKMDMNFSEYEWKVMEDANKDKISQYILYRVANIAESADKWTIDRNTNLFDLYATKKVAVTEYKRVQFR